MEKNESQAPDTELAPEGSPAAPAAESPSGVERIKTLEEEKKTLFEQLIRRQADFENFRKRIDREQQEARQRAEAELVAALLPVLDAFERALAAPAGTADEEYRKGVELIYKQMFDTLARAGLKPLEVVGQSFDPFLHHAVERVETTDHDDQKILAELQRGYTFKERLLRPALVRVAVSPAGKSDSGKPAGPED